MSLAANSQVRTGQRLQKERPISKKKKKMPTAAITTAMMKMI